MAQAKDGDCVLVHYHGKLDDGTVFESSLESDPLEFTIGEAQVMPGFQKAVVGMSKGDNKSFSLTADEGFGIYQEQLVQDMARADLPPELNVEVGTRLNAKDGKGNTFPVIVTKATDTSITLDANHPLAGKNLNFEITLVEIVAE